MILGIILLLSAIFVIFMTFMEIKKSSDDLLSEKKNLKSFSEGIKDLQESKKFYEAHQADLDKIDRQFVDPTVPVDFIKFLEKTAADANLSVEISPISSEVKEEDLWPNLSFQLIVKGTFSNVSRFLEKLENSTYLIEVINLSLTRTARLNEPLVGDVDAIITLKAATK